MYYIVQFSKDGQKFRTVSKCYFDGYSVGDRFLEGADFEVTVSDTGDLIVKATELTAGYLRSVKASVSEWEKTVYAYIVRDAGYDNCSADFNEAGWSDDELHITTDLEFYVKELEMVQEK